MYLIAIIAVAVMSVITFFVYAADKLKAKTKAWRVPEKVLLGLSFFGGAIGGYAAMSIFRHKTKHWYFQVINLLSIALHVGIIAYLFSVA